MSEIRCRIEGRAGRITLNRPAALNALTHSMLSTIERAIDSWRDDDDVDLVVIDAEGERAFCAGGDIQRMYDTAILGDYEYGRRFWRDEYRLNAKIFSFPKPWAAFMQGFTMGGGVGVSCHGSHRVVCDSSTIAMPECGIGLVPDVGGSLLLSRAPGRLGEYLGTTGFRMGPADAIHAGFADYYIPQRSWPEIIAELAGTGDWTLIDRHAQSPPESPDGTGPSLISVQDRVDRHFGGETIGDILRSMDHAPSDFTAATRKMFLRNSPLSMACTVEIVHRVRESDTIFRALEEESRFTFRSARDGDFIEGIRAAVIDRDRNPKWRHSGLDSVSGLDVTRMLMPLGDDGLKLDREALAP